MASWGDIEVYNEMISDLGVFVQTINEACTVMLGAAQTCMDNMESDAASIKAYKNVTASVREYQEAIDQSKKLANDLAEERDRIIEYLRTLEQIESGDSSN